MPPKATSSAALVLILLALIVLLLLGAWKLANRVNAQPKAPMHSRNSSERANWIAA